MFSIHKPFFILPDGSESCFYKMKTDINRIIILHDPYFRFDYGDYDFCKEEYNLSSHDEEFIDRFIQNCEKNSGLKENEILWANSGYWSLKNGVDLYIGVGFEALKNTLFQVVSGIAVYCLENVDFCVFIKYVMKNKKIVETEIDIYTSTIFRPWVEILEPFRKAIPNIVENKFEKQITTNTKIKNKFFSYNGNKGYIFPYAISPTEQGWIGPTIIKNNFGFGGTDYLFTQAKGGWLKEDFFKPSECYSFTGNLYLFDDILVIRGSIVLPSIFDNVKPTLTKEFYQYKKLVDMFSN